MKKSVIFLINGLGIERPNSYSISIDQTMPQLSRIKETSYFTTAVTSSLEYKSAYQSFYLGDTYKYEIEYLNQLIMTNALKNTPIYPDFINSIQNDSKLHIFMEPTNKKIVEVINNFIKSIDLKKDKKIFLHLLLSQQTTTEYEKLISIINQIKYYIDDRITVGFVIGKESIDENLTADQNDLMKKLLFYCSAERWTETEKKLLLLKEKNIRPCEVQGFCTNNDCYITNKDVIMFFNTKRENYDNYLNAIINNTEGIFKEKSELKFYSLLKLYSKYNISSFIDNIEYQQSLANILQKSNKKALIITDKQDLVNFYANGNNQINNPLINYLKTTPEFYNKEYISNLINNSEYDLFIFDYQMNTSKTVNFLKEELTKVDLILGNVAAACENKNSLFITSLYGLKKQLPVADYNTDIVEINYEMQIPIFFFDYTYPKSKYDLFPGETNNILTSALRCIIEDETLYSLVKPKTFLGSIVKSFIK